MISFKPIKGKTQFKQTLSSDLRSNIYNNQMEYEIHLTDFFFFFSFFLFFFLQTDTTNTELKPLFGSSICKIESVFTEDNIESVPDAKETVIQGPKEHMLLPYHLVLPYVPGSPRIPVPAGVGCTQGCGANLLPLSIQRVLFFQQEGSKSLPWE